MTSHSLYSSSSVENRVRWHWFRAAFAFIAIAGLAVLATLVWPRTYQSEMRLYVRLGRETVHLDPTATTGQTVSLAESREREITSALELLRTRALFERVVDELGVENVLREPPISGYGGMTDYSNFWEEAGRWIAEKLSIPASQADEPVDGIAGQRRRENAIRKLMQSITSSSPKNANVIIVQCRSSSPETSQERLECLLRQYQQQHLQLHRTTGSLAFFDAQAEEKKSLLNNKLLELRDAKNQISVASVDGQQELLSREAAAITQSLLDAQAAVATAKARLESLLEQIPESDRPMILSSSSSMSRDAIDLMRSRLFDLEIEHQRLLAQLQPAHPKLKAISEQVTSAKAVLKRQEALVEQSTILEQQEKCSAALKQQSEVYAKLRTLNEQELKIADLERQKDLLQVELRKSEENREQARTDEELTNNQISNLNLAQAPSFGAKPISPNVGWNLLMGLTLAGMGAAAALRGTRLPDPIEVELARDEEFPQPKSKQRERQLELQI